MVVWVLTLVVIRALFPSEDAPSGSGVLGVLLILSAAVLTGVHLAGGHPIRYRFCWVDAGVTLLVAAVLASVPAAAQRHAAVSLAWEWLGVGVLYWLVRIWMSTADRARMVLVMVVAMAVCVSAYGVYQVGVELPRLRTQYESRRDYYLARQRPPIQPGSARQQQFEQRLYSGEPCATFALANSLAGVLVLALPIGLGLLASTRGRATSLGGRLVWWLLGIGAALGGVCLILTKSRSAYVALVIGLVWMAAGYGRVFWKRHWKLLAAAVAFLVVAAGVAIGTGRLDRLVLSETGKSLRYRLQYWQGAWRIIHDRPWLGVGPGNFGEHYQRYKVPSASEEVQDPHNAVLELWSTSGVGAAMLAIVTIVGFVIVTRRPHSPRDPTPPPGMTPDPPRRTFLPHGVLAALIAVVLTEFLFPVGWSTPALPIILLALVGATAAGAGVSQRLATDDALPHAVIGGVLALAVHLMAAGGISYPAVAMPLWCTVAAGVGLVQVRGDGPRTIRLAKRPSACILVALLGLMGVFCVTWCWPHVQASLAKARATEDQARGSWGSAERNWQQAADLVPSDPEPWRALAGGYVQLWTTESGVPADRAFARAEAAYRRAIENDPYRSAGYLDLGLLYLARARRDDPTCLTQALAALRKAVTLYPNNAERRVYLAQALWLAGDRNRAREQACRAVWFDAIVRRAGHSDKILSADNLAVVREIVSRTSATSAPTTRP